MALFALQLPVVVQGFSVNMRRIVLSLIKQNFELPADSWLMLFYEIIMGMITGFAYGTYLCIKCGYLFAVLPFVRHVLGYSGFGKVVRGSGKPLRVMLASFSRSGTVS